MSSPPLLSVVIPTYHRNDLLAKCLERLAPGQQTLAADRYEVIVTDDGHQTTAQEMIQSQYPWVIWVEGPHRGAGANRNCGAQQAQGEWLVFTDDDCLPSAGWLEAYVNAITLNHDVYEGFTGCEAGIRSPLMHAPSNTTGGFLWSCNMMIRTDLFRQLGGFDAVFPYPHMEDVDFRERILEGGYSFPFVRDAVVDHPPRKRPWGDKMGAYQESSFYYFRKKGETDITYKILRSATMSRLRAIKRHPLTFDSVLCFLSLLSQLYYIMRHVPEWGQKYKDV